MAIAPPRDVDLVFADAQQLEHGQDLHREGLVELDAIDLVQRESRALECFLGRRDGPDAHLLGIDPRDGHRADAGRSAFKPSSRAFSSDITKSSGRADVDRRAVAGRHRAPLGIERRGERRE